MILKKLNKMVEKVHGFEKKAGFEKTPKKQLVGWLKKEIKNYEKAKTKLIKQNKLMDITVLVMQIAKREDISLNKAWKRWWRKSKKYLK